MEPIGRFVIGPTERRKRWRNIGWGGLFSIALVIAIVVGHERDPVSFNSALLWSVIAFAVLANLVNLVRFVRYLRLIRDHYLEIVPGRLRFSTGGDVSELDLDEISAMRLFHRGKNLDHIQLMLKNNRGIRLEGYEDFGRLEELLRNELPESRVMG